MSSTNPEIPLPPHDRNPIPTERTGICCSCGEAAPVAALANFGARCGPCFRAYCSALPPLPKPPGDRDAMSRRAYTAARLSTFEQRHGKPLSPHQRDVLEACTPRAHVLQEAENKA